jgi:hypothetical protein
MDVPVPSSVQSLGNRHVHQLAVGGNVVAALTLPGAAKRTATMNAVRRVAAAWMGRALSRAPAFAGAGAGAGAGAALSPAFVSEARVREAMQFHPGGRRLKEELSPSLGGLDAVLER